MDEYIGNVGNMFPLEKHGQMFVHRNCHRRLRAKEKGGTQSSVFLKVGGETYSIALIAQRSHVYLAKVWECT